MIFDKRRISASEERVLNVWKVCRANGRGQWKGKQGGGLGGVRRDLEVALKRQCDN